MKYLIILSILALLLSCGGDDGGGSNECGSNRNCENTEECKFSSVTATKGTCITKKACTNNVDCSDSRLCAVDEYEHMVCGGSVVDFMLSGSKKLTPAVIAKHYTHTLSLLGASGPFNIVVKNGSTLPAGLQLNTTTGVISGTPTTRGNYSFTLTAYNGEINGNAYYNVIMNEKDYTLMVGVECQEGYIDDGTGTCVIDTTKPVAAGEIIITEVMADSKFVADDFGEWIEIYNTTERDIDLSALMIVKGTSKKPLTGENLKISAKSYFVIAKTEQAKVQYNALCSFGTMLSNSGATISIEINNTVVDTINYSNPSEGKSLQLSSNKYDATSNDSLDSWCDGSTPITDENTDLGTPGSENSLCGVSDVCNPNPCTTVEHKTVCSNNNGTAVCSCEAGFKDEGGVCVEDETSPCFGNPCVNFIEEHRTVCIVDGPDYVCECETNYVDENGICVYNGPQIVNEGDLIITEVMADPNAISDSAGEWVEIYNTTDHEINLSTLNFVKATTKKPITGENLKVAANSYFVVAITDQSKVPFNALCAFGTMLSNSGSTISIEINQTKIDEITYPATSAGKSYQLNVTKYNHVDNNDAANWCVGSTAISAENADKGTPGSANSSCGTTDVCNPNPCTTEHKTVCTNNNGAAVCSCDTGYHDENGTCVIDSVDHCTGVNCNHGECLADDTTFICVCDNGWSGDFCNTQTPTVCNPNPCTQPNKTVCTDNNGAAVCSCDNGYHDENGNCVVNPTLQAGDIIITEFMANPKTVDDTLGEWIEIYNTTSRNISLDGFVFIRGTNTYSLNQTGLIINANNYFVIAKKDAATAKLPIVNAVIAIGLNNSGAQVLSIKIGDLILDEVSYSATALDGKSFQLNSSKLTSVDNDTWTNWCAGSTAISAENTDLGTPGTANTVCQ